LNKLLTYAVMLHLLILAYIQFMIMLIELESAMSETKVFACVARLLQSSRN